MVKSESGFTLVEVLIATVLLTIGILAMATATMGMTRMLSRGDRSATAAFYTQERLERLRGLPCASITAGSQVRGDFYQLAWTVSAPNLRSRQITVVTTYPGRSGQTRADSSQTRVSCL